MVAVAAALLISNLLAACLPFRSISSPTQDIQAVYTSAAETMRAQMTLDAGQTAVSQITQPASQTPQQAVPPKKPTDTPPTPTDTVPVPTAVVVVSTATPASSPPTETPQEPCDRAEWVGDVTTPNGTIMPAGSVFTKIWRVRNAGSCTWTPSYSLAYTGGNLPVVATTTYLPGNVSPGQLVDLSVTLTAPPLSGVYQGAWMFRNPSGQMFGVGPNSADPLIVQIRTIQPISNPEYAYDITAYYCAASWRSGAGLLACPGSPQDAAGSVLQLEAPVIETRRTSEYGLWVRPNQQDRGWITGTMPAYLVQPGDYFFAEIGCLQNSPNCDVVFELDYQIAGGASGQLGRWREAYDGVTTLIDQDLSDLSGRSIYLVLSVYNNGLASDANAIWLQPRVQQSNQRFTSALTWTRDGYYGPSSCDELRISFSSTTLAIAQAFDCSQGSQLLGQMTLTAAQVNQLSSWIERLDTSEGEIYSANRDQPITARIFLRGLGQRVATNEELRAMESFATQIFSLIVE
jgi:hypothetical protein